ncbi:MAG: AAA family ATPase, partial [Zetaproteobacteria bacterium]
MTTLDTSNASLVNTWILRLMLSDNDALLKFYDPDIGFRDDDIARFLGLPSYEYDTRPSLKQFKALLRQKLSGCAKNATLDAQLARNLDLLSKGLALNETQRMLLAFALLKEVHEALGDSFNRVKTHHEGQLVSMLSAVLNINRQDIKQALSPSGVLRRAGLINLAYNSIHEHVDIEIMNQLKDAMLADNADEKELLAHFLLPSEPGSLRLENYPHIAEDIAIITRLLASALRKQTKGINILLYGPPGTGKTELARLLAHEVHASLFEVRTQDDEGDPEGSMGRLMGYRLSQSLLSCNENSLILFDEVEDIFPTRSFSFFGIETTSARHKGWTNKALEENPVPTIWISNTIKHFDPSILRRFDYALEVPVPPRSVRLAIARDRLQGTPVSEAFLARLAEHEQLSAAQIAKSAKVVRNLGYEDPEEAEQTIERVLERSIRAMGQKPLPRKHPETTAYSLEYLNINA